MTTQRGWQRLLSPPSVLVALAVTIAFSFQGSRGLYETTEGRYAEAAREMIETGDWLVPQLDYHPHWSKPPLAYWAVAGGMLVFGQNEWGARASSGVAHVLVVLAVLWLGTAMWGRATGLVASLVYATAPLAIVAASGVSTDPILALWEALAALAYWRAIEASRARQGAGASDVSPSGRPALWVILFWLFAGLGFITKGPPSLLTPLVAFVHHGFLRVKRAPRPALYSVTGLAVFAVVGLSWYLLVVGRESGLMGRLVREEVVGRIFSPSFRRNPQWYMPFAIIIVPFALGVGQWVAFWPGIWRAWRKRLPGHGWARRLAQSSPVLFCLLWIAIPLVILSVSRSRLTLYVVPFLPALALLTGRGIVRRAGDTRAWRVSLRIALASAFVLVALKGVAAHAPVSSDIRPVAALVRERLEAGTPAYGYGLEQEYGLMFYLDGRMVRVSQEPGQSWARLDGAALVSELSRPGRDGPSCLVARSAARKLEGLLDGAGLRYWRKDVNGYAVFSVAAFPGSAPRPQQTKRPALQARGARNRSD